jgi:hypothetical protein
MNYLGYYIYIYSVGVVNKVLLRMNTRVNTKSNYHIICLFNNVNDAIIVH